MHPRVIFEPRTTLMAVMEDSVLFAECDVDVHSHDTGPFFYINQFNHVQRLIRIPIHHFLAVMRTEGPGHVREEDLNLILLSNVGRCGSTLLTQLFEQLPETVSISEPECLMPFAADPDLFRGKEKEKEKAAPPRSFTRGEVLKACVLALVASSNSQGERKTNIVIKPKAHAMAITRELDETFKGRVRHLYLYRHPAQYVTSVSTVFNSLMHPVVRSAVVRFSIKMGMESFIMTHFQDKSTRRAQAMLHLMEKVDMNKNSYRFAALFCANIMSLVEQREAGGIEFKFLSYHELIKDAEAVMTDVSKFCGIDCSGGTAATAATDEDGGRSSDGGDDVGNGDGDGSGSGSGSGKGLALPENDSQNNSGLSRQHLNNYKKSLDDAKVREIDHVLRAFKFATCETFPIDSQSFEKMRESV